MAQPTPYDGEKTTSSDLGGKQWRSTSHRDTQDYEKIGFVGTLLVKKPLEWHQARARRLGDADTWAAYSQEIQEHYADRSERATAFKELKELKYRGDIRAFFVSLELLNRYAEVSGESLQILIDRAVGRDIVIARFLRGNGPLLNDADYLKATLEAGIMHEDMLQRFAIIFGGESGRGDKIGASQRRRGRAREREERARKREEKEEETGGRQGKAGRKTQQDRADVWKNVREALAGIAQHEIDDHKSTVGKTGCWRCGNKNHRSFKCYAGKTKAGTPLPKPPTRGAAATSTKRKREVEPKEESPAPKQQKKILLRSRKGTRI